MVKIPCFSIMSEAEKMTTRFQGEQFGDVSLIKILEGNYLKLLKQQ